MRLRIFSFYSLATGLFTGDVISGSSASIEATATANTPGGCAFKEGAFDRNSKKVDLETGQVVAYTPPGPTIEEIREARWIQIKAARDAAQFGGFELNGNRFDTDADSQRLITGSVVLAQVALAQSLPFSITWTLEDNSTATLDAEGMIGVGVALGVHIEACYAAGRAAREAIEAAETAEEVAAVEFSLT
jgi:hypothetical protein